MGDDSAVAGGLGDGGPGEPGREWEAIGEAREWLEERGRLETVDGDSGGRAAIDGRGEGAIGIIGGGIPAGRESAGVDTGGGVSGLLSGSSDIDRWFSRMISGPTTGMLLTGRIDGRVDHRIGGGEDARSNAVVAGAFTSNGGGGNTAGPVLIDFSRMCSGVASSTGDLNFTLRDGSDAARSVKTKGERSRGCSPATGRIVGMGFVESENAGSLRWMEGPKGLESRRCLNGMGFSSPRAAGGGMGKMVPSSGSDVIIRLLLGRDGRTGEG
jgi:hypothetical protein